MRQELSAPLNPEEQTALRQGLLTLLQWQITRYTAGDSTSVRVETVQELLASLCVSLGLAGWPDGPAPDPAAARALLRPGTDWPAALRAGQRRLQNRWALAKQLWRTAYQGAPPYQNQALRETLQSIGAAFGQYDLLFFAHSLPGSIDYPLCCPLPETWQGAPYLAEYLARLNTENAVLAALPPDRVQTLLWRAYPDVQGQLVSLCEPVLDALLGCALLGLPPQRLSIPPAARDTLAALPRHQRTAGLRVAAASLNTLPGLTGARTALLLQTAADHLDIRLEAALRYGGLENLLVTLPG